MREMSELDLDIGRAFLERSTYFLNGQYLPKIQRCLDVLSEDDVWARANKASNSIGNLLLHLNGNLRQWVVCGVGGQTDRRDRQAEFDARGGLPMPELDALLSGTVREAVATLAWLEPPQLTEVVHIQGRQVSVLGAIYHAVEHFGQHTAQIILLTKQRTARSMEFYRVEDGIPRENW